MIVILLFFLYLFIFFWPVINSQAWFWEDFPLVYFPLKAVVLDNLSQGIIPYLNNFINGGNSLLADVAAGIFYPLNVLLIPFWTSNYTFNYWLLEIFTISHLLIAFVGMLWLGRRVFKISKTARVIAALIFSLGSFLILHQKHVAMIYTAVWLPWIFGNFYIYLRENKYINLWWTAAALSLSALAGHLQIFYYICLWLGFYALVKVVTVWRSPVEHKGKKTIEIAGGLFFLLLAGAASGAIQFLPFWELLSYSSRQGVNYFYSVSYSLDYFGHFLNLFLPHLFGGHTYGSSYFLDYNVYWEATDYISLAGLSLAVLSWFFIRKVRELRILWLGVIIFFSLGLGDSFITHWLASKLLWGFSKFRAPARVIVIMQFILAIIAGLTWQRIVAQDWQLSLERVLKIFRKYFIYIISFLLLLTAVYYLISRSFSDPWVGWRDWLVFVIVGFSIYTMFSFWLRGRLKQQFLSVLFVVVMLVDFYIFGFEFNLGKASPIDYYENPSVSGLRDYLAGGRAAIYGLTAANVGMPLQIPLLNGYHYLVTRELENVTKADFSGNDNLLENSSLAILNMFNVRLLYDNRDNVTDNYSTHDYFGQGQITANLLERAQGWRRLERNLTKNQAVAGQWYKNQDALGNVWLVDKINIADPQIIVDQVTGESFAPRHLAYLEEGVGLTPGAVKLDYQVSNYRANSHGLSAVIRTNKRSLAIFSQNWLPGYQATINGSRAEVLKVNHTLLGVMVPAGSSVVSLNYFPRSYYWGRIISISSWLIILAVLLFYYLGRAWHWSRRQ